MNSESPQLSVHFPTEQLIECVIEVTVKKIQRVSGAFAKLSESFVTTVCPSVFHPHGTIRFPLHGRLWYLLMGNSIKIFWEYSILINTEKIWETFVNTNYTFHVEYVLNEKCEFTRYETDSKAGSSLHYRVQFGIKIIRSALRGN